MLKVDSNFSFYKVPVYLLLPRTFILKRTSRFCLKYQGIFSQKQSLHSSTKIWTHRRYISVSLPCYAHF